jgi:hypothetical protein
VSIDIKDGYWRSLMMLISHIFVLRIIIYYTRMLLLVKPSSSILEV